MVGHESARNTKEWYWDLEPAERRAIQEAINDKNNTGTKRLFRFADDKAAATALAEAAGKGAIDGGLAAGVTTANIVVLSQAAQQGADKQATHRRLPLAAHAMLPAP